MQRTPVLDKLFNAIMRNDAALWAEIDEKHAADMINVRALICSNDPGAIDLDLGLGTSSNEYVVPIFEGPRAHFLSRHTSIQNAMTGGRSNLLLDYSLSFDSNFAEKLRATIEGEAIQAVDKARVLEVLTLKAANPNVQFDLLPFLYENVRLARSNESNRRPLNTLIAFRMLDHLDWEAFLANPDHFDFGRDKNALKGDLKAEADAFMAKLYDSPSIAEYEAKALATHALLLRLASVMHEPKSDPKKMLAHLIDFSIFELGFLPMTELSFIWSGIGGKEKAPFFGKIVGKSKDMLDKISGMAWDITHLRIMERIARESTLGSFFIPYFVTFDQRWRELVRTNPIRFTLFDDAANAALFGRANELDFQRTLNSCFSAQAREALDPASIEARRQSAKAMDPEHMKQLISAEMTRLR